MFPKAAMDDARGTLESRYDTKVKELLEKDAEAAVEYMLKAVPLIDEYTGPHQEEEISNEGTKNHLDTFGFTVTSKASKNDVFCRYMAEVEGDYTYLHQKKHPKKKAALRHHDETDWSCPECNTPTMLVLAEAALTCPGCGLTKPYIEMNHHNLSFDEQVSMEVSSHCAYKRVNHFSEWINSLQARESTVIPDEILDAVRAEFKKTRATTRADITPPRVKAHLKKLRLAKWYEHTHSICNALYGTPPPALSPALETRLKTMFNEIQAPFDKWVKVVAPQRKNFLSYGYVLYKFCELLGEDSLLHHFSLLKSQDKLYQMDAIWKRICAELKWEYIPSL